MAVLAGFFSFDPLQKEKKKISHAVHCMGYMFELAAWTHCVQGAESRLDFKTIAYCSFLKQVLDSFYCYLLCNLLMEYVLKQISPFWKQCLFWSEVLMINILPVIDTVAL